MPSVSVVIPAHNAAAGVVASVEGIANQAHVTETFVVDDGSSDDTRSVAVGLSVRHPIVRVVALDRDTRSGRSRARNYGARQATGDYLLFLDSGWVLDTGLLEAAMPHLDGSTVIVVPFAEPPKQQAAESVVGAAFDPRWGYIEGTAGDLSRLASPWLLAWTGTLLVPRKAFEERGGFDEDFIGWGAEDIELGLRLFDHGLRFRALTTHWAKRVTSSQAEGDRTESMKANVTRLQRKHPRLETELLHCVGQLYAGSLAERLEALSLAYVVDRYEDEALAYVRQYLVRNESLLIGAPLALATALETTHLLAHSKTSCTTLRDAFPRRAVSRFVGALLPEPAHCFDVAIVTDFLRVLPPGVIASVFRELARVSRKTFLIFTVRSSSLSATNGFDAYREAAGWPLCPIQRVKEIAAAAGFNLDAPYASYRSAVFDLAPH